jgi:hypothetical protein
MHLATPGDDLSVAAPLLGRVDRFAALRRDGVIAHGVGPVWPDQAIAKFPPMRSRMAWRAG